MVSLTCLLGLHEFYHKSLIKGSLTLRVLYSILIVESLVAGAGRSLSVVCGGASRPAFHLLLALSVTIVLVATCWLRVCGRDGAVSWHLDGPVSEAGEDLFTCLRSNLALEVA